MKADRLGPSYISRRLVGSAWSELIEVSRSVVMCSPDPGVEWIRKRTLVLKDPMISEDGKVREKGVYLIKFTTTFPDVFRHFDLEKLQNHFHLILEPSWAGYCLPEILSWASLPQPVWVQASEVEDRDLLGRVPGNLIPVEFGSGDWVDPNVFFPIEGIEKEYDVIYVANFNSIKRQYVFLKTLKSLSRKGIYLKAALVCGRWGECKEEILDLIDSFSLCEQVDFHEGLSQPELNILLNKSKANVLLSLKEGSNRSLFEGFFSGTPGIVLDNNVGVNKSYFNHQTGVCIPESMLEQYFVSISESWQSYSPRAWAMENISPLRTTEKLVEAIRKRDPNFALADVTQSRVPVKVNAPEATLWGEEEVLPSWDVDKALCHFGLLLK